MRTRVLANARPLLLPPQATLVGSLSASADKQQQERLMKAVQLCDTFLSASASSPAALDVLKQEVRRVMTQPAAQPAATKRITSAPATRPASAAAEQAAADSRPSTSGRPATGTARSKVCRQAAAGAQAGSASCARDVAEGPWWPHLCLSALHAHNSIQPCSSSSTGGGGGKTSSQEYPVPTPRCTTCFHGHITVFSARRVAWCMACSAGSQQPQV
jgi:hypothetical protein